MHVLGQPWDKETLRWVRNFPDMSGFSEQSGRRIILGWKLVFESAYQMTDLWTHDYGRKVWFFPDIILTEFNTVTLTISNLFYMEYLGQQSQGKLEYQMAFKFKRLDSCIRQYLEKVMVEENIYPFPLLSGLEIGDEDSFTFKFRKLKIERACVVNSH